MIYILVILSILVFLLGSIVFGLNVFTHFKKEKILSIAFGCAFVYTAFLFSIQVNGLMHCVANNTIDQCIHYPQINEIPIIQIGFDLASENLKLFLVNLLTFGLVFFLAFFLKRQLTNRTTIIKNSTKKVS
jgi:hypothetical protein